MNAAHKNAAHDKRPTTDADPAPHRQGRNQKGGQWAKLAGMWCADRDFWAFCNAQGLAAQAIATPHDAADLLRLVCEIDSRAELDHDAGALHRFNENFRHPFMRWMQARGIAK